MVALFMCGVIGYLSAKRLRQPKRSPKQAKKLVDDFDDVVTDSAQPANPVARSTSATQDKLDQEPQTPPASAHTSKARRRSKKQQGTVQAVAETSFVAEVSQEVAIPTLGKVEDAAVQEAAPVSERVAKLLAKKALRKAKKAQERLQQEAGGQPGAEEEPLETSPAPAQEESCSEVPAQPMEEEAATPEQPQEHLQAQPPHTEQQVEEQEEQVEEEQVEEEQVEEEEVEEEQVEEEQQLEELEKEELMQGREELVEVPQQEVEEDEEEWEEEEWEDEGDAAGLELPWHGQQEAPQEDGEVLRISSAEWDQEWSDDSEEWPAEDLPTPPSVHSGSWKSDWTPSSKWKWQKGSWRDEVPQRQQDGWMLPFDEILAARPPTTPTGPPVCIHQGDQGTFTDGQQVFQPVQSGDGRQLFTDGDQVFMPVCVVVGAPPGEDAGACPMQQFSCQPELHGPGGMVSDGDEVEEEAAPPAFDPYNPMRLGQQMLDSADAWDTCWG
eukprot:CAMPEP_0197874398 /NCGR_PEP_ID=MMETSP1439-20131203/3914_1 /TAXON_ID=66791 /ORGANISM="Gonyaulax spinifera, Strain CCMP409" /LENGTH=495 /DNA_ID=CAMNT_0043493507 /DNA_START=107 /DNA_END=1594 /DNA_ORIENTATION=-